MVADICVVGGDVLGADPHDLIDFPITATMAGGRVVHEGSTQTTTATTTAVAGAWSHERGLACLRDGKCCCRLAEETRA
jgi:hypothetical protein